MELVSIKKEHNFKMSDTGRSSKSDRKFQVTSYSKLVVPISMRSIYWQFYGFPATADGEIISRSRIVCVLCRRQIAYNRNTSNLRMHLQNKHIRQLAEIEPNAVPRSKVKSLREAVDDALDVSRGDDSQLLEGDSSYLEAQESKGDDFMEIGESFVVEQERKDKRKKQQVLHLQNKSNLLAVTSNYIIIDLHRPDIVDEMGYQRLLLNIENPCSIPTRDMVGSEIIPKIYNSTRAKLQEELHSYTGFMAVTIEEWQCVENRWYATICVYYPGPERIIQCKVLKTFSFLPQMDASIWESMLAAVFMEWNILTDQVTAVVCSMEREAMVEALTSLGFTPIPCLDATIKEAVRQCLSNETVVEIMRKVRQQISVLMNNPLTAKEVQRHNNGELPPLILDVEAVWLSTLEMLETALLWKDILPKVIDSVLDTTNLDFDVPEAEWDVVQDLVTVLQPLKMALMSIKEEKMSYISIVRPMLWQVTENKLILQGNESETCTNLKKATIDLLNYRYADDRVIPLLDSATFIDPRFKLMPYYSDEDRTRIEGYVHSGIKDIVIQAAEHSEEEAAPSKKRLSNMALLLGEFKSPKLKMDTEGTSRLEYRSYLNTTEENLDGDPVQWWWRNHEKFPRLNHLAEKHLCVPAVATLPSFRMAENPTNFHHKRATMVPELIDKLVFLHINHSVS